MSFGQDMRRMLETSFEPHGDGFVYYRNRWAKGVPVTADEREAYLENWTLASARQFHRKIADRQHVTPARGGRATLKLVEAAPKRMVWLYLLAVPVFLWEALKADAEWWRVFLLVAAAFAAASGTALLVMRALARRQGGRRPN